ncbi:MAG: glycosyltransferase [Cyanobacteria bacterium P01_D01_bin.105]
MGSVLLGLAAIAIAIWIGLLAVWGQFWRADQWLDTKNLPLPNSWPTVAVVIPARNEAELIGMAVRSHLTQSYPGQLFVVLVDDQSIDSTADIATQVAKELGQETSLTILSGKPLPAGWTGKLWAMEQGFRYL